MAETGPRMGDLALCKCGVDLTGHSDYAEFDHVFDAAGTRHRCELMTKNGYMCPRPMYHHDHGVECGPLVGTKLW